MLTYRQRDVLAFVQSYQFDNGGVSPSFSEIMAATGVASRGNLWVILHGMESRGIIRRLKRRNRAIEVVRPLDIRSTERYHVFRFDDKMKELIKL